MASAYFMARDGQYGLKPKLGNQDKFYKSLYSSIFNLTNYQCRREADVYGAVFNLEFSPDSSVLIAACEKRAFVLWDPVSLKEIKVVENAHRDCVNCIKFLNRHTFATCSDDSTIALWDLRNLKKKTRSFSGHSNWVKSIEFDAEHNLLVSAGFDGNVYSWPLNTYTETSSTFTKVLTTSGLMRCQLSADATKLVICTTAGFLIVIHNLDLESLGTDLAGFKPNIFRLMQLGRQHIPSAAYFTHLFSKYRLKNRVELIADFPEDDDAEVITSVQIHPKNWCIFSRNISLDESSEWSCLHDIRTHLDDFQEDEIPNWRSMLGALRPPEFWAQEENQTTDLWEAVLTIRDQRTRRANAANRNTSNGRSTANRNTNPQYQFMHYIGRISSGLVSTSSPALQASPTQTTNDNNAASTSSDPTASNAQTEPERVRPDMHPDAQNYEDLCYNNTPRLLRYIPEANIGRGFIKESSFSPDGRVISSPFGYGVRLLSFNDQCQDYNVPNTDPPQELITLGHSVCHKNVVICTKFSPRRSFFASGCVNGELSLHNPVL